MPWALPDRPSSALAALEAYVRRERPRYTVECYSEFVDVCSVVGDPLYYAIARVAHQMGMLMYMPLIYPERFDATREYFLRWSREGGRRAFTIPEFDPAQAFEAVMDTLRAHLADLVQRLSGANVVGMTCTFAQLFANIALAKELKRVNPEVRVVLGGASIPSRTGRSVMREYECVDFLINGEGERPLVALLDSIASGDGSYPALEGLLARGGTPAPPPPSAAAELPMDELPVPSYDDFARRAERHGIPWILPIETSRGCWWDRTKKTGNAKDTCFFCSLNVQWRGYRQKSTDRVADEMSALSERYQNLKFTFLDNIMRLKEVDSLAESIKRSDRQYSFFHELRANITPYELLLLSEAGLSSVQIGIEALSNSLLVRINKGTSTILNLAAMKYCDELGIAARSNLIADFPGSTVQEVSETRDVILKFALHLRPLSVAKFGLMVGSTVDALRTEFGVAKVRNLDVYRNGLPDDVWNRLELFDLDFEQQGALADWTPVREACEHWSKLHQDKRAPLLLYRDGRNYITIDDARFGEPRAESFSGVARDIYVFCMEVRTFEQITRRFLGPTTSEKAVLEILQEFVGKRIMYSEQERYLSLALAPTPLIASNRIREQRSG